MESYGKLFVVVAVLAAIMAGIFVYLFTIDRKVRKLEKELKKKTDPEEK